MTVKQRVERAVAVTAETMVPLSVIGVLAGGIFWLSTLYAQGNVNAKAIEKLNTQQEAMLEMKADIAVIKNELTNIRKVLDEAQVVESR